MGTIGTISLIIPQIGQPDTTEDVKVQNAFTTIQAVINGNIDTNNISPTAAIKYSQLSLGAWSSLTLGTNITAVGGDYTPAARIEGDVIRLRGTIQNSTGGTVAAGVTLFTVPSLMHPASAPFINVTMSGGGSGLASVVQVALAGTVALSSAGPGFPNAFVIGLSGLSYMLS